MQIEALIHDGCDQRIVLVYAVAELLQVPCPDRDRIGGSVDVDLTGFHGSGDAGALDQPMGLPLTCGENGVYASYTN